MAIALALGAAQVGVTAAQTSEPGEDGGPVTTAMRPGDGAAPLKLADLALRGGVDKLAAGDARGAIDMLRLALQGQPDNPDILTALADAYVASASDDATLLSLDLYNAALRADPKLTHAREGLARAYWMTGEADRTLHHMEVLYLADGEVDDRYAAELATYYMLAKRIDRGLRVFARALPKSSERHATMLLVASMLMQKHDKATARIMVERVLVEAPPDGPLAKQATRMLELGVGE